MNLVIDIGNSRMKLGLFQGANLQERIVEKKFSPDQLSILIQEKTIQQVIISSSGADPAPWLAVVPEDLFCVHLDHETPLPITNAYRTPETLGRDRLAGAVGAHHLYPETACLSIDIGTCITYDFIDAEGVYHGGAISPGMRLRFKSMHHFTANLPLVKRQRLDSVLGFNTVSSMASGAQFGMAFEIDGYIQHFKDQHPDLKVLLSGGDTSYFVSQLKSEIFAHPNLVLSGLNQILEYNASISR
ncbi:MAG: type III pantothenate kinase [Bacteroidota bacterium]